MIDDRRVRRLVPEMPFPSYTYVPGRGLPHPVTDPAGHSFGLRTDPGPALEPATWRDSTAYLFGFDLLNHQFYWEAHETWESLWNANGRRGTVADFLKALIKLAASGVKHREGRLAGTRTHARRAAELWRRLAGDPIAAGGHVLGLRVRDLIDRADQIARDGWPETGIILLPDLGPARPDF